MPGFELIGQEEFREIESIFQNGGVFFRHGFEAQRKRVYKVRSFEKDFARYMQVPDALAVSSGSVAIKVALKALGLGPGDEVITQAFTFVATVEAIIETGAQPVIAEIDETLNMDPVSVATLVTPKTKAIIAVHMLGTPARMEELHKLSQKHNVFLLEDTAWGCGGKYKDKFLGTIGDAGTYSFDYGKTMTTGEGGMVIFRDQSALARARAYHDHGHENNPKLPRWEDTRSSSGFNYRMTELQGAVGIAQLKKLTDIVTKQRQYKQKIVDVLNSISQVQIRPSPPNSLETADALVFFTERPDQALACRKALVDADVGTKILPEAISWHFTGAWEHMPELAQQHANLAEAFPRSLALLSRAVALPVSVVLDQTVAERVGVALRKVFG